ncbi:MAG: FecR domain-containing protein [Proteobacteria bacterium]|nr:FecR domain-containing protein [Pseudomonadota bacterium]
MNAQSTNDEAAEWAVRLDGEPLSAEEQRALEAWLASAPGHRGALVRARAVWAAVGAAQPAASGPAPPVHAPTARGRGISALRAAAAALAAVAVLALGYRALELRGTGYETGVGEVRRIALEDGSAITLNSNSAARVRYGQDARRLTLVRGEGLFEVAKDPARPFIVSTGGVAVRAVGTAFVVRALTDAVTVTVTEGVVEVTRPEQAPRRVAAHQRAEIRAHREVTVRTEEADEASRQLSWRDGVLSFSGESLAEAVREVNRYSHRQIEVADPGLAARPVIGIFRAGDADAFAQATAAALGAETRLDGDVIRLVPPAGR